MGRPSFLTREGGRPAKFCKRKREAAISFRFADFTCFAQKMRLAEGA